MTRNDGDEMNRLEEELTNLNVTIPAVEKYLEKKKNMNCILILME